MFIRLQGDRQSSLFECTMGSDHRGDMGSPIALDLVYIMTLTDFSLELVFFRLGPGVAARISKRLPAGGASAKREPEPRGGSGGDSVRPPPEFFSRIKH